MSHLSINSRSHDAGMLRKRYDAQSSRRMSENLAQAFYMHLKLTGTNLLMTNKMHEMQAGMFHKFLSNSYNEFIQKLLDQITLVGLVLLECNLHLSDCF